MNDPSRNGFWLGVDLAQQTFDASLASSDAPLDQWRRLPVEHFDNTAAGRRQLRAWLKRQLPRGAELAGVCVESTGRLSHRFAEALRALAPEWPLASIINPKRSLDFIRSLGVRDKSDRIEAALLALYGAKYQPPPTVPLSPDRQHLQEACRLRETLLKEENALGNRRRESNNPAIRRLLQTRLRQVKNAQQQLEKQARQLIRDDAALKADYRLLLSIKGIGFITAWVLLAELGDLRQYSRTTLVGRVGIYPRHYQSGHTVYRKPRLVKGGGALVRKALFNAARAVLSSKDNTLKDYADRLQDNGKARIHCMVAVMRKLLLVARSVLVHNTPYDPEHENYA